MVLKLNIHRKYNVPICAYNGATKINLKKNAKK